MNVWFIRKPEQPPFDSPRASILGPATDTVAVVRQGSLREVRRRVERVSNELWERADINEPSTHHYGAMANELWIAFDLLNDVDPASTGSTHSRSTGKPIG